MACSAAVAGIKLALHGNDRYQHRRCNDDAILPSAISEFRSLICMDKGYTLENRCRPTKMPFDWDQANTEHIARHRVTPADTEQVISGASLPIETEDRAVRNGTPSWARPTQGGLLVVVWTWRRRRIRVVTAFPANRRWRALWRRFKGVQDA